MLARLKSFPDDGVVKFWDTGSGCTAPMSRPREDGANMVATSRMTMTKIFFDDPCDAVGTAILMTHFPLPMCGARHLLAKLAYTTPVQSSSGANCEMQLNDMDFTCSPILPAMYAARGPASTSQGHVVQDRASLPHSLHDTQL
jgi:hypothetical protein